MFLYLYTIYKVYTLRTYVHISFLGLMVADTGPKWKSSEPAQATSFK